MISQVMNFAIFLSNDVVNIVVQPVHNDVLNDLYFHSSFDVTHV